MPKRFNNGINAKTISSGLFLHMKLVANVLPLLHQCTQFTNTAKTRDGKPF